MWIPRLDHNCTTCHFIEDMFTANNLIFMQDETTTPTLYHRSIGTMSIPDLNLVPADIVNKTQVHCSAKYQINPYKACSSGNALTRTTEQSVMPSKPLPNNASHGFTYRFTHIHKYQQFWTEDILNTTQPNQKESRKRPNQ